MLPTLEEIAVSLSWAAADSAEPNYVSIDPLPEDPAVPS